MELSSPKLIPDGAREDIKNPEKRWYFNIFLEWGIRDSNPGTYAQKC